MALTDQTYAIISRIGATVLSALATLVVTPPVISTDDTGILFKGLVSFIASTLFILLYDKLKGQTVLRSRAYLLAGLLIVLTLVYQVLYVKLSVDCSFGEESQRIMISSKPVKRGLRKQLENWKTYRPNQNAVVNLLKANGCSSVTVWDYADLAVGYYSLITFYFLILATFTVLLVLLTEYVRTLGLT